jgi:phage N-6-adenine-methyltransferase
MAKRCNWCKAALVQAATGRPALYCSIACRMAAYRKRKRRSVHFQSNTCEWATPPDLFAKLNARFSFTLDPCATPENAKCARYFTRADDGLAHPWQGRVFCNPPYGRDVGKWVEKAWRSVQAGTAEVVVKRTCP